MEVDSNNDTEYLSSCNICFLLYDEDQRRPKVLPCSHTFCLWCLQAICKERTLSCPVCRSASHMDDVATLPNNIYALHIVQLNQHLQGPMMKMSMHWCFSCNGVAKQGCKEIEHNTVDMSEEAKDLQNKMKQTEENLKASLLHRRQVESYLEQSLVSLDAQTKIVQEQMVQNRQELESLHTELNTGQSLTGIRRRIENRLIMSKKALKVSTQLSSEWRARSEAIKWIQCNPSISWRQIAHLLKHQSSHSSLEVHQTKRTCIELSNRIKDKIIFCTFNPVKPMLACAHKSGKIGIFTGENHFSPFADWSAIVPLETNHYITSIDWNSMGCELAIGFKRGNVVVWNSETKSLTDYGYVLRDSRITIIRWNRKWAPDVIVACSKKRLVVWDVGKSKTPQFSASHALPIKDVIWISADAIATSCNGSTITIFRVFDEHQPTITLHEPERDLVYSPFRWNPATENLAYCSSSPDAVGGVLMIWSLSEERDDDESFSDEDPFRKLLQIESYGVLCVDWNPFFTEDQNDPQYANVGTIAGGTNEDLVVIWDPYRKNRTIRLSGHSGEVNDVAYSSDGKYLASLSKGRELIIWSTTSWTKLIFLDGLDSESTIIWSPCCTKLILFERRSIEVRIVELGRQLNLEQ